MFNHEHFPIHRELHILPVDCEIAEIVAYLNNRVTVCIPLENGAYLFTEDDLWLFNQQHGAVMEWGTYNKNLISVTLPYSNLGTVLCCEEILKLPSRTGRPVVFHNENGTIAGYSYLTDILKFAIKEQQRFSSYFFSLAETVPDAVTVVDQNGTVICWNETAEKTYGIPKKEILGRRIGEHFKPESLMVLKMLDENRTIRNTYHRPRIGHHVLINASPIVDAGGRIIGGIATEQDITQIVHLNEELSTTHAERFDDRSDQRDPFSFFKGKGSLISNAIELAKKIAGTENPLLLTGEDGVGKEQLAKVIHQASPRSAKPFMTVHCGYIPTGLLETELFGFQGGTFSGNNVGSAGKLEMADQGTLFLNDIDRLPLDIQAKLMQSINQHSILRMGAIEPIPIRTRIIAATTRNLPKMVEQQLFRADLYYAINVISIALPSLRDRKEDIPSLVQAFARQFAVQYHKPVPQIDPEVALAFSNYEWPGNINELMSIVERCIILSENERITMAHLPQHLQKEQPKLDMQQGLNQPEERIIMLKSRSSEEEEKSLIQAALDKTSGNKSAAAKLLGISRGTLYNKMKSFHME